MKKQNQHYRPLSLAQHFDAPEGFYGRFGWICSYSADAAFMDNAAERFSRRTHAQRAYLGQPLLALMLDPTNPNISLIDAPSVAHLPIKDHKTKPFRLLHTKIALLCFSDENNPDQWLMRLIVSTGNWTRETLEQSLDLAWRIDLTKEDLKKPDNEVRQICADMSAAWNLLDWLSEYFDMGLLNDRAPGENHSESANSMAFFNAAINKITTMKRLPRPRFFDNRRKSLISQLPAMIKATETKTRRNYLAMGSGFYEAASKTQSVPSVLNKIVSTLKKENLLTASAEIDVYVNPKACQNVAASHKALTNNGYSVRPPGLPAFMPQEDRTLHAKFIFSAESRANSDTCNSAWLYLGSGNLTGPGFLNRMSSSGGNLETGIVFTPRDLYWCENSSIEPSQIVTNVIPIQWDMDASKMKEPLLEGAQMENPEISFIAAPVPWMLWSRDETKCWLKAPDGNNSSFDLLDATGRACIKNDKNRYLWEGNRPRQVEISWVNDGIVQQAMVPILDEFGRLAASELPQIDLEQAWCQLANFPMPPEDEELNPSEKEEPNEPTTKSKRNASTKSDYPIRKMMELIENIAAKQTSLSPVDWSAWCARLEQSMTQTAECSMVREFARLGINPLSPLWHAPFRPTFAETGDTSEGQHYERVLQKLEEKWNVEPLKKIGGNDDTNI